MAAGDRSGEAQEAVCDAVFEARHAAQHALEGVDSGAEGDEVEAVLGDSTVGHRAAQHESGGIEALLGRALHVGVGGGVRDLFVVLQTTAYRAVALGGGHALEARQIVNPALRGDEAAAVEALTLTRHDRDLDGALVLGVLGAVLSSRWNRGPRST